jgi:hypothetical protein
MWQRPPVESCPIVKKTQGVVLMEHWVIAEITGASTEEYEWTALFLGERDERNLVIKVDNLWIPDQIRGRGHVKIPDNWKPPAAIAPDIVGVIHIHPGVHYNSAVGFSGVDTGPGGLNERWPMSMVIGRSLNDKDLEAFVLGISYEIKGRCVLPCGAYGTIDYFLHPAIEGEPDDQWPWPRVVVEPTIYKEGVDIQTQPVVGVEHPDLADCSRYTEGGNSNRYLLQREATCGLRETSEWFRHTALGATGEGILHHLPQVYPEYNHKKGKGKHGYKDNGRTHYSTHDYRQEWDEERKLLPGWSESTI